MSGAKMDYSHYKKANKSNTPQKRPPKSNVKVCDPEEKAGVNGCDPSQGKVRSAKFPDRWLNYVPVGRDISDVRIVAFKTPLHSYFFDQNGIEQDDETRFEVSTLVDYAKEAGKTLGLVVDLTNTDRYYSSKSWDDHSVEYLKLRCRGHEVHEQEPTVQRFFNVVSDFLAKNADNDKVIGVHCTHGLNRTGYLICRYMIDCMGWSAAQAIDKFERCRGHPMERKPYIDSLYKSEAKAKANKNILSAIGSHSSTSVSTTASSGINTPFPTTSSSPSKIAGDGLQSTFADDDDEDFEVNKF